jgi:uncharacterized cupin superfamily protein
MKANVYDPEFDSSRDENGFSFTRSHIGRRAGSERLGASLFELEPGATPFPFHQHLGNEEMLIVLSGRPHLRDATGWRQLEEGEVVAFPVGERGGHQVQNRTDEKVRILIVSEMNAPEVVLYPDSGKIAAREEAPGPGARGIWHVSRLADSVGYMDGESPPDPDA